MPMKDDAKHSPATDTASGDSVALQKIEDIIRGLRRSERIKLVWWADAALANTSFLDPPTSTPDTPGFAKAKILMATLSPDDKVQLLAWVVRLINQGLPV